MLKSSYVMLIMLKATYPFSNTKLLACDTANEHALTCIRETWRLSIHIYSNGREHYSDS